MPKQKKEKSFIIEENSMATMVLNDVKGFFCIFIIFGSHQPAYHPNLRSRLSMKSQFCGQSQHETIFPFSRPSLLAPAVDTTSMRPA